MFGIGSKKRKQDCLLLTEDGRLLDISLPVVKGYVVSEKTGEAWGLFPDSCIPVKGTNRSALLITERDCAPVSLNGGGQDNSKRLKDAISKIAQESASAARAAIQKKGHRQKFMETLRLVVLIFAIGIVVLVIFGLLASGKLHLPGSGGEESIFSQVIWSMLG